MPPESTIRGESAAAEYSSSGPESDQPAAVSTAIPLAPVPSAESGTPLPAGVRPGAPAVPPPAVSGQWLLSVLRGTSR